MLRSAFIALSTNKPLRRFSENSSIGRKLSGRFVAGMAIDEVVRAAEKLSDLGIASTLDSLGENVYTAPEAQQSADTYHRMLDAIATRKIRDANVSLKLTQMGMDVDPALAESIVSDLTTHAAGIDSFVRGGHGRLALHPGHNRPRPPRPRPARKQGPRRHRHPVLPLSL